LKILRKTKKNRRFQFGRAAESRKFLRAAEGGYCGAAEDGNFQNFLVGPLKEENLWGH